MDTHHPQLIGVLLPRPLQEPHNWLHLSARMDLACAQAPADAFFPHEINEVALRGDTQPVAREMSVFGRADKLAA